MNDIMKFDQRQAWFNTAIEKLHEQGGQSVTQGRCVYVHPTNGRNCGVGVLLTEGEKEAILELDINDKQITIVIDHHGLLTQFKDSLPFVRKLQAAHDTAKISGSDDVSVWSDVWSADGIARRLQNLAIEFDLDATMLYRVFGDAV